MQKEAGRLSAGKRITLKDVSELSGYSLRTVKKVISGTETVSDGVRKAVLEASAKLNYRRNRIASALARNRMYKIALVYAEASKYYFPEVEKGFELCLNEYHDYGISVEYFKCVTDSYDWQRNTLDEIESRDDISAAVVQPMSATGMNASIDRLADAGKPVVTFGSDAPGSKRLCYIGPKAGKSGRIAAQIMASYIGKKGNVYMINQLAEHMQTAERSAGFSRYIADECPDINVYKVDIPVNARIYYDIVSSIARHEQVNGFFCTDADVYLAGRVLADLGRKDITLIGYDLPDETCSLLREGYIKVILCQNPEMQGYQSLKTVCDYLLNHNAPIRDRVYTDVQIITSECLDQA